MLSDGLDSAVVAAEWDKYAAVLSAFEDAGLSRSQILDTRGNHDTACSGRRGEELDLYPRYGAMGGLSEEAGGTRRAFHARFPPNMIRRHDDTSNGTPTETWRLRRASKDRQRPDVDHPDDDKGIKGWTNCPGAVVVQTDLNGEVGLRAPLTAMGSMSGPVAEELGAVLELARAAAVDTCPTQPVPLVAYGHYPLSCISKNWSERTMTELLSEYGVSTYLTGHLHRLPGPHLHGVHPVSGSHHALYDLMGVDWKHGRGVRLLAVTSGHVAHVDLTVTPDVPHVRPNHPVTSAPASLSSSPDQILANPKSRATPTPPTDDVTRDRVRFSTSFLPASEGHHVQVSPHPICITHTLPRTL
jgi:hypothetical protein